MEKNKKKYISFEEAKLKLASYCAYQERCHQEVIGKLNELGVYGLEADQILLWLIQENFLNEERFAKAFAGGKFRVLAWGKLRIQRELKQRNISDYCIKRGLEEINEESYLETLKNELRNKMQKTKAKDSRLLQAKVASYLISRGFEPDLVWMELRKEFRN